MAAPAITVSSDMERMVAVTRLETFVFVIFNRSFRGCESSTGLYQAASKLKIGCKSTKKIGYHNQEKCKNDTSDLQFSTQTPPFSFSSFT
jgi:hypothetical protein